MKKFENNFGIVKTEAEARNGFVIKLEYSIINSIPSLPSLNFRTVFQQVCTLLGLRYREYVILDRYPSLSDLTQGDFLKTLEMVMALYTVYKSLYPGLESVLDDIIPNLVESSSPQIGVRWANGEFYPDPIPEIDAALLDQNLVWLNEFPAAKKDIQFALNNIQITGNNGVIEKCYSALENVAQALCKSKKALHTEELKSVILKSLNTSQKWKSFLNSFVEYANDLRHGKDPNRHLADPDEIESYMYLSLIMIRMILKKINSAKPKVRL